MRKSLVFLFAALMMFSLVSSLEMYSRYDTDVMVRGLDSEINLELIVTDAEPGNYNLYTLSDIVISPSGIFRVENESFSKEFVLTPRDNLDVEGNYAFTYILNHRGFDKYSERFVIDFVNLEDIIVIESESVNFETGQIDYYIENTEDVNIENLSVEISSVLFEDERVVDLGPNERLELSIMVDANKLKKTNAGVYIMTATFDTSFGEVVVDGNLYLGEKKGITSTEDNSGLLIRTHTVTKVNTGNVVESISTYATQDIFSRFFTTFNEEPDLVERDGLMVTYTWIEERLDPAEVYVVKMKTNYALPFLVIVGLTALFLWTKKVSESKVEIKKRVSHVRTKTGEFALRIILEVNAKKAVENVKLVDRVPAMVKIYNKFDEENKPDRVSSKSRSLHWDIGEMKAGEVKLYSYIVYSKVGIVGKFVLPEARASFEKDDRVYRSNSSKVYFMSEQGSD